MTKKLRWLGGVFLWLFVFLWLSRGVAIADPDALKAERARRASELVKQNFHFTHGVVIDDGKSRHLEWMLGEHGDPSDPEDDNAIALWFETARGSVAVKLTDARGTVLTSWQARSGEQRLVGALPEGRYTLDVTPLDGATTINGLLAIQDAVIWPCDVDAARVTEYPADPAHGYAWPYLLSRAARPSHKLLVVPVNTGLETDRVELLRSSARCDVAWWRSFADQMGADLLVPMLPRPKMAQPDAHMYIHALSRDALLAKPVALARADRQLLAMIDSTSHRGERVWLVGFSAAAMFVNRFTILHPERVRAVASISPGGWPIAPVATERGERLTYPVGIADLPQIDRPVDLTQLRKVPQLFLIGANDTNDSMPYRDSHSEADAEIVNRLFGTTPVARWPAAQRIYEAARLDAKFTVYPDTGHEVTRKMMDDIAAKFAALDGQPGH